MSDTFIDISARPATTRNLLLEATPVTAAAAACSRLLGRGMQLQGPSPDLAWRLLPGGRAQGGLPWLGLNTIHGELFIEDGHRLLRGLTGLDGPDRGAWPSWLAGALAGRLQDTLLASVVAVRALDAPPPGLTSLQFELNAQAHQVGSAACASAATWLALLRQQPGQALRMPWLQWQGLELSFAVPLASHRLPLADVQALAAGDVILPAACRFDVAGTGRIALGERCWRVRYLPQRGLELIDEENQMDAEMMDDAALDDTHAQAGQEQDRMDEDQYGDEQEYGQDPQAQRSEPAEVGSTAGFGKVAVSLRFELGRVRLSLDQLRALGPQCVIELLDGAPQSLAIHCGGAEVGRGEVVDVEGRLGVRITHWGGAC
ncbi:type III secretion system cytoplasmic ring protein SctQ [Herbaspirillum sp. YR522]|uniref:type III secretion system cytoplasmic ring protein SctQ n=1 Tax=Herbaspirillum sp. YR522 TaxID=1144342 RepID=UPI00026F99F6|nr:type III secretion system cytoplasmic ring protein SctQ [Herbaspirillum sp. YR522]EJN02945.1 type III secretion system apparatus protein YscQ/HrcQ [Herbaspirillum sp. YR522]